MFLLLLLHQVLQMCDNVVCITTCVRNAISWVSQLHFHLVDSVLIGRRNFVKPYIVSFLFPPMFIIKKLQWVLHDWNNCTWKVNGRANQIVENKKGKTKHDTQSNDKQFQTWAQPCIPPPHLGHSIWLALTDANIYSATKVDNVPPTKMEAPVISEVLEFKAWEHTGYMVTNCTV